MSADPSQMYTDDNSLDTNWLNSLDNNLSSDPSLSDIGNVDPTASNDAYLANNGYGAWQSQGGGDGYGSLSTAPGAGGGNTSSGNWLSSLASLANGIRGGSSSGGGSTANGNLLNSLLGLASGAYGLSQANNLQSLASQAITASNPFGPYRAQYAQQLSSLASNPNSITSDPGYQAAFNSGNQAVARQMAGSGYAGSGNEAIALQQYGQNFENNYYNQQMNRLAGLAGANITPNPGPGLSTYIAGVNQAGASLGSLGYGSSMASAAAGGSPGGHFNPAGGEAANTAGGTSNVAGYAGIARNIANLAGDFGIGSNAYAAGNAAGVVGGLAQGGAQGYGSAAVNATELAGREGYITSPTVNNVAGYAGGALQLYSGIKQGGVVGDTNAAVGAATIATKAGYLGGASGALGEAIPYASAVLGVYNFATQDTKSGATGQDALGGAETGAETGASIGSIIPGIGTAIGAVVGGVIGGVAGAVSSAFGPGAMDPENVNWNNYASAYDSNPKSVAGATPTQAYQTLAGIFDARGSNLPFYQKFGRMGENRFTTAMTQQINNAVKSGQISTSSTPQQIYSTVVQPWISSMSPNGWQPTNTEKGAAEQPAVGNLLTQMIGQYQQGQQGSWTGVGGQQPFLSMPGFGNTASAQSQQAVTNRQIMQAQSRYLPRSRQTMPRGVSYA